MRMTRREMLAGTAAAALGSTMLGELPAAKAAVKVPGIRLGICDWSLGIRNPAALDTARKIKLDGVEISPAKTADKLSYADGEIQKRYKAKMTETGLVVCSLGMTITNSCPLASDPRGPAWLEQSIDAAHALGAKVILLAFFGKGSLQARDRKLNQKAVDAVVARVKAAAARAKAKGVILGLENTLSAKQNLKILDAVDHESVQVYYDIANSTRSGYDVPAEIRMLKDRICQFHFKDNKGLFDSGNPKMGPIIEAIKAIGYQGWIVLERSFGKDRVAYFQKNAQFVRKALGLKTPS